MANEIEITTLNANAFVAAGSRYANSAILKYGDKKILTFETYKRAANVTAVGKYDVYMVITPGLEYRPDLLANEYYGASDFWWRILEANGMMDIFDFKSGVTIRLPQNVFKV